MLKWIKVEVYKSEYEIVSTFAKTIAKYRFIDTQASDYIVPVRPEAQTT